MQSASMASEIQFRRLNLFFVLKYEYLFYIIKYDKYLVCEALDFLFPAFKKNKIISTNTQLKYFYIILQT